MPRTGILAFLMFSEEKLPIFHCWVCESGSFMYDFPIIAVFLCAYGWVIFFHINSFIYVSNALWCLHSPHLSLSHLSQTLLPTQSPPHFHGFCVFVSCRSSAGSHNCSVFRTATVTSYPENSLIMLLPCWFFLLISGFVLLGSDKIQGFFFNLQRQAWWLIDLSILKKVPPDNEKNAFSAAVWWGVL